MSGCGLGRVSPKPGTKSNESKDFTDLEEKSSQ